MGNSLYQKLSNQQSNPNNFNNILKQLKSMGPSNAVFNQMYQNNPQFRNFANSVRGKTPEEAFRANGLDFGNFKSFKW